MMEKFRRKNEEVKVVPSDIWLEILHRIPAVDLLPLKAVCKTFHLLISDDLLTRLHLKELIKHPKSKRAIIILIEGSVVSSHSIYDPDKQTLSVGYAYDAPRFDDLCNYICSNGLRRPLGYCRHRVIDSYHGLLLLDICDKLLLCNPITRSYKVLPSMPSIDYWSDYAGWKIVYDDVSKQYKVFGLGQSGENRISFYVYDVDDRDDRKFRETTAMEVDYRISMDLKDAILVNGNVYILIFARERQWPVEGGRIWRTYIVSANVTTEKVKTRNCSYTHPSTEDVWWLSYDFFAANGSFYIGRSIYPHSELQLWVLEGVESENCNPSWSIKRLIPIDIGDGTILHKRTRVLGMFGGKLLIMIVRDQLPNRLCQYDLGSGKFENVIVTRGSNNSEHVIKDFALSRIVEHVNSLISL